MLIFMQHCGDKVTFRDFQSISINVSQLLLQGTSIAGMGVDLKLICWEDIRQSSLLCAR